MDEELSRDHQTVAQVNCQVLYLYLLSAMIESLDQPPTQLICQLLATLNAKVEARPIKKTVFNGY